MDRMHLILPDIILNKDRLKIWRKCVTQFQTLYFKLRTHLDFTEDEVVLVQKQIDSSNACWLELAHKEGMTNYIHMLSSGHIAFYLRKWKNLYRYQNQGWEHLNLQITYVFHHRTQYGGHSGNTRGGSLKTWPLGMWMLRRLYWLSGRDDLNENLPSPVTPSSQSNDSLVSQQYSSEHVFDDDDDDSFGDSSIDTDDSFEL
jgi:hypothetical protein